nr:hypothetical protein [Tanacetum cinerariifolium]
MELHLRNLTRTLITRLLIGRSRGWTTKKKKPDPSEMKKIVAEGILTCLQDAIDSLNKGE